MPTIAPNIPERKAPSAWAIFLAVLALALAFTYLAIATGPLLAQGAQTQTGAFDGKGEAANVFFGADKVG